MSGSHNEDAATHVAHELSDDQTIDGEDPAVEAVVERPSRRHFFLGAAAVATAALVPARRAKAQRIQRPRPGLMSRPDAPSAVSNDVLMRLVNRITLGATEEEMKRAKSLGFTKYLEYHLKFGSINDSATACELIPSIT